MSRSERQLIAGVCDHRVERRNLLLPLTILGRGLELFLGRRKVLRISVADRRARRAAAHCVHADGSGHRLRCYSRYLRIVCTCGEQGEGCDRYECVALHGGISWTGRMTKDFHGEPER